MPFKEEPFERRSHVAPANKQSVITTTLELNISLHSTTLARTRRCGQTHGHPDDSTATYHAALACLLHAGPHIGSWRVFRDFRTFIAV